MIEALGLGLLLGVSAGMSPGPLLALVLSQTLRFGAGAGVRVALAPLITDLPIVVGAVLLVGVVPTAGWLPSAIAAAGGVFVAYLAIDTWRTQPVEEGLVDRAPRSWTRRVVVNFLSPHPYLFWLAVGAPTLLAAVARDGAAGGAGFLVGFYGGLVGSKIVVALATARARGFVSGRGYRIVMRVLAVLLAVFALGLLREAVLLATGNA
jgi:threonine/homoserine/homoserine lactone efflux protein